MEWIYDQPNDVGIIVTIIWKKPGSDIFKSKVQTLVNTVNCKGFMGKGLAKKFKAKYKSMFDDYKGRCINNEVKPGRPYLWKNDDKWILNFPTKNHYAHKSQLKWIEEGLEYFKENYKIWGIESIAFPALGCNNGQLSWGMVKDLMEKKLSVLEDIEIEIYPPHDQRSPGNKDKEQTKLISDD